MKATREQENGRHPRHATAWALSGLLSAVLAGVGALAWTPPDADRTGGAPAPVALVATADLPAGVYTPEQLSQLDYQTIPPHLLNSADAIDPTALGPGDKLTLVLDFKSPGEPNTTDIIGNVAGTFDVTAYGFGTGDFDTVVDAIFEAVLVDYFAIEACNTSGSPLPPGNKLAFDIVIGDIGVPPSNGASEYYYLQIGSDVNGGGPLGQAALNSARDENGNPAGIANGSVLGSVFTDNINGLPNLTPPDALTSGDLDFTKNAIGGTTAHEMGHTVSLLHLDKAGSVTPNGLSPLMGTGPIDLPNQDRIFDREFAISGVNFQAGGQDQFHIQQLISALGLNSVTGACCVSDSTCFITTEGACESLGGVYQGDGTDCSTPCCPLNVIWVVCDVGVSDSQLAVLDPSTGVLTAVGPVWPDADIEGMTRFDQALLGVSGEVGSPHDLSNLDFCAGAITTGVPVDFSPFTPTQVTGMATDGNGVHWAYLDGFGFATMEANGSFSLEIPYVDPLTRVDGVAASQDGTTLWAMTNDGRILEVDVGTGNVSLLADLSATFDDKIENLTRRGDDLVFFVGMGNDEPSMIQLVTYDLGCGDCDISNCVPGCSDPACEALVCTVDPFCCAVAWDSICAGEAEDLCGCGGDITITLLQKAVAGDVEAIVFACLTECSGCGDCDDPDPDGLPGCSDSTCQAIVCAVDPFCCNVAWDGICANEAEVLCECACGDCGVPDPNGLPGCSEPVCEDIICAIDPFCCNVAWDSICANEAMAFCSNCVNCGDCAEPDPNGLPGCSNSVCENIVCAVDPFCCNTAWDSICAGEALDLCDCGAVSAAECDLDQDGVVGILDLLTLFSVWGVCTPDCRTCPADFDGDCAVGITDTLILLENWG